MPRLTNLCPGSCCLHGVSCLKRYPHAEDIDDTDEVSRIIQDEITRARNLLSCELGKLERILAAKISAIKVVTPEVKKRDAGGGAFP